MPSVKIVESVPKRIIKAPFRATSLIFNATGSVIKATGHGISKVGKGLKMGKSSEWVPEADAKKMGTRYVKTNSEVEKSVPAQAKKAQREVKVFNEKGGRLWGEDDWDAMTEKGSVIDEKLDL